MTEDALTFTTWFFEYFWYFFTGWIIPGTVMTPAQWLLFILFFGLILRFIFWFLRQDLRS